MMNLGRRAKGHFVTLIEIDVDLIRSILDVSQHLDGGLWGRGGGGTWRFFFLSKRKSKAFLTEGCSLLRALN